MELERVKGNTWVLKSWELIPLYQVDDTRCILLDTGTVEALSQASEFVRVVERSQGVQISAVEEIAYINGWIAREKLLESAKLYGKSPYGAHLKAVAEGKFIYGK